MEIANAGLGIQFNVTSAIDLTPQFIESLSFIKNRQEIKTKKKILLNLGGSFLRQTLQSKSRTYFGGHIRNATLRIKSHDAICVCN